MSFHNCAWATTFAALLMAIVRPTGCGPCQGSPGLGSAAWERLLLTDMRSLLSFPFWSRSIEFLRCVATGALISAVPELANTERFCGGLWMCAQLFAFYDGSALDEYRLECVCNRPTLVRCRLGALFLCRGRVLQFHIVC